jgi:hypothetical protein
MSVFSRSFAGFKERLRRLTLIEWLVIIMIITVLAAILIPPVKWASSGRMQIPVRVFVFDAQAARPIARAQVTLFRAPPLTDAKLLSEFPERYDPDQSERLYGVFEGVTGADGMAVIENEFRTGANHEHPITRSHVSWVWVAVKAKGYSSIVVPLRYEDVPTAELRKQGELSVTVGLLPTE